MSTSTDPQTTLAALAAKLDDWRDAIALAGNDRYQIATVLGYNWTDDATELVRELEAANRGTLANRIEAWLYELDGAALGALTTLGKRGVKAAGAGLRDCQDIAFQIAREVEAIARRLPAELEPTPPDNGTDNREAGTASLTDRRILQIMAMDRRRRWSKDGDGGIVKAMIRYPQYKVSLRQIDKLLPAMAQHRLVKHDGRYWVLTDDGFAAAENPDDSTKQARPERRKARPMTAIS